MRSDYAEVSYSEKGKCTARAGIISDCDSSLLDGRRKHSRRYDYRNCSLVRHRITSVYLDMDCSSQIRETIESKKKHLSFLNKFNDPQHVVE